MVRAAAVRAAAAVRDRSVPSWKCLDGTGGAHDHPDLGARYDPAMDGVREVGVRNDHPARPTAGIDVTARPERRPAGVTVHPAPGDPGRTPNVSRHPVPADSHAPAPAPVV